MIFREKDYRGKKENTPNENEKLKYLLRAVHTNDQGENSSAGGLPVHVPIVYPRVKYTSTALKRFLGKTRSHTFETAFIVSRTALSCLKTIVMSSARFECDQC